MPGCHKLPDLKPRSSRSVRFQSLAVRNLWGLPGGRKGMHLFCASSLCLSLSLSRSAYIHIYIYTYTNLYTHTHIHNWSWGGGEGDFSCLGVCTQSLQPDQCTPRDRFLVSVLRSYRHPQTDLCFRKAPAHTGNGDGSLIQLPSCFLLVRPVSGAPERNLASKPKAPTRLLQTGFLWLGL